MKAQILIFTLYQIGNELIDSGVGCGFYDENGKDNKRGIKKAINEYLFEVCFNIDEETNIENARYFIDFLLINSGLVFGGQAGLEYVASKDQYLKLFYSYMLISYWKKNREKVILYSMKLGNRLVSAPGYVASYGKDLHKVFRVLDEISALSQSSDSAV